MRRVEPLDPSKASTPKCMDAARLRLYYAALPFLCCIYLCFPFFDHVLLEALFVELLVRGTVVVHGDLRIVRKRLASELVGRERHLVGCRQQSQRPDGRVVRLIKHMGAHAHPKQKRVLCMNKIDIVENKKDLLKVAKEFGDLPGYERYFMISGLKGSGVKDLSQYLTEQAVKRPWDEEPTTMDEDIMKSISLEVVREKMLDHIHQEIPYTLEHRLTQWTELRDGSLRIQQEFITHKQSQRKILVGKNGSKIGRIGLEANEELRSIFQRDVHLFIQVRVVT
ncbi:hypothetical protein GIB67_015518 [Kingdonia uniflora]|uniref:KH type-2 domain-containing protein n=1 Tax=Kingdonia uniflora TaxID=39325 RepID=A0A7J7LA77_9MAGN|nr:hypothetical protein GIB67_015518 [Kingdonia uniflora]